MFLLFLALNRDEDRFFFWKYCIFFKSEYFAQFLNFYNKAENSQETSATSPRTITPMSANIFIFRTGA